MENLNTKKIFKLFNKKAEELKNSKFNQNLSNSGVKINMNFNKKSGFSSRSGPDYEEIKNFVITFRNFILDSDPISIRNISKVYESLEDSSTLKKKFSKLRKDFNNFLDSPLDIQYTYNNKNISNRNLIDTYIYGDVIHLEKNDEFEGWISISPIKAILFNEIVKCLNTCNNFINEFNELNKEYIKNEI